MLSEQILTDKTKMHTYIYIPIETHTSKTCSYMYPEISIMYTYTKIYSDYAHMLHRQLPGLIYNCI